MKILLITSKWPTIEHEIDGGCMTALNVISSMRGYAHFDLLLPNGYKDMNIPEAEHTYYYPVTKEIIDNYNGENKFSCRITISEIVNSIVLDIYAKYDRIIVLHTFHAFGLCKDRNLELQRKIVLFPMLLTPSYIDSGENVPDVYTKHEIITLSSVGKIITPSEYEYSLLRNYYHIDQHKICIIPRFVGHEFKYADNTPTRLTQIRLCYIASIKKQKQNILAIKLLNKLTQKMPNVFLYMAGPIHDTIEYQNIVKYINGKRLQSKVKIINSIPQNKINELFSYCFANISVSRCETFGRSIIEGLYCGLPAFVLNDTKCFKTLIGEHNGVEYFSSIDDMAERILTVYNDKVQYENLRSQAHSFGLQYDESIIVPQFRNAIIKQ